MLSNIKSGHDNERKRNTLLFLASLVKLNNHLVLAFTSINITYLVALLQVFEVSYQKVPQEEQLT